MSNLFVVGLGLDPVRHGTVEGLQALGECDEIFVQGLDDDQTKRLRPFWEKAKVRRLDRKGETTAVGAIRDALAKGKTVGIASLGHPFYWSALAGKVVNECEKKKIPWQTFGSISPMGVAISQAGVTLGTDVFGLQSYDCAALAGKGAVLNPEWPLAVYFYADQSAQTFKKALARLLADYGKKHKALWCLPGRPPEELSLPAVEAKAGGLTSAAVLFLPARSGPASKLGHPDHHPVDPKLQRAPEWVKE